MIYFLQTQNDDGLIKIGYSESQETLKSRIATIKTACPYKLKLIKTTNGSFSDEGALHERFLQYKAKGEWFYPKEPLIDFIKSTKAMPNVKPQKKPAVIFGCKLCGHEWQSRKENPAACPRCKRYDWNDNKNS